MNKKDLKKFIEETGQEWHWNIDQTEMYLIVSGYFLEEFASIFSVDYLDECPIRATIVTRGSVCVEMVELCNDHGIEPKEVFNKPSWDSDETF